MTYYGSYNGWRYSPLTQINPQNVAQLTVKWTVTVGKHQGLQATPIVVDGIMYLSNADNSVYALNAATGERLWRHGYMAATPGRMNRGVAVAGSKVFLGTWDAYLPHIFPGLPDVTSKSKWVVFGLPETGTNR